jgi:dihydropteroate synthase
MLVELPTGRPAIMGILNVTPDSFSDGGLFLDPQAAIDRGLQMVEEGADLIDVGGESTRPGAEPVSIDEELSRVIPVVSSLSDQGAIVSIDTMKSQVASEALFAGARIVNDVSGLRDPAMIEVCVETGCTVCIMHMLGAPKTMQSNPLYGDVIRDVKEYLFHAATVAEKEGVAKDRIWIDPGIGFGKTVENNCEILRRLDEFVRLGYPVLVGVSRKSFLGKILGSESTPLPADQRLEATLAAQTIAQIKGARILRVHDVLEARRAAEVCSAIHVA